MAKYLKTEQGYINASIFAPAQFKPEGKSYLTFSSPKSFTLKVNNATKNWDGTLEYFSADKVWTVWDGTTILFADNNDGEYVLYLRGTGNTVITGSNSNYKWVLTGNNIRCIGNIENLLDYATVTAGNHPTMASNCYYGMFYGCTSLTQAPALPATTLVERCYSNMFCDCTSLTQAPALPATTLADNCYYNMFSDCTSLTKAPALPATTLANNCYQFMFTNCTSLTQAPALPATTLADNCYYSMFQGCTSLIQAPELPATTLTNYCYRSMFSRCTSLTQAPALPATTLATSCYYHMFYNCTSLTQAPALPATTLAGSCYSCMFCFCTALTQAPALPATTLAIDCYGSMFSDCTSLTKAPTLPATTLANKCYNDMFRNCHALKFSKTKTGEYTQEYRIPTTGTGTTGTDSFANMFTNTGGTFTGTPSINTTYYLSTDNMIVRDTEVATLNGYVGSMIDVASIQSDWNQNDDTQPDYVKNRPFYTGDPVETVLVEESTTAFSDNGGVYAGEVTSTFSATVGNTYMVYWDGAVYESVCADYRAGHTAIGNLSIAGAGADTGEPFLIMPNSSSIYIYTADTSASHTISIRGFDTPIVKIDEKYLPEYSVLYSGNPANWTLAKKQQMYDDFISGKLVLYQYSDNEIDIVLSVFYSATVGLKFVFFTDNILRRFDGTAFSNPIELTESGINDLIKNQINNLTRWKLYSAKYSEVSVGDLLSMYVAFDSTTKKACISTDTKSDIGNKVETSTIVTNGDSDIVLSSSTFGSTKKFKITVDDSGTLTTTEVT